jgi:BASS family bile acid:Na+ symporter
MVRAGARTRAGRAFYYALAAAVLCVPAALVAWLVGFRAEIGWFITALFGLLAIGVRAFPATRGFSFTLCIFAAVSFAMFYPGAITEINGFNTQRLIVPLLQIIMFGMGTAMSLGDFTRVIRMPKAVVVGLVCQFSIMPVVGATLALIFRFPPEVAAGVVLIGSVSGGLASNVITYLAKGNVALSVTLTAVSTLMAPVMTPFLMRIFAGQFITVEFLPMMLSIIRMVILPIVLGLVFNRMVRGRAERLHAVMPLLSMAGIAVIIAVITAAGRDDLLSIGMALVFAAILHNTAGYLFGYWGCRALRMDETTCRTIAIEVGMQNGGLASGIAAELGRAATLGLAPAVFGPWMNISGSLLANWWRDRPIPQPSGAESEPARQMAL